MSLNREGKWTTDSAASLPLALRVLLAFLVPIGGTLLLNVLVGDPAPTGTINSQSVTVRLLAPLGIISLFLGKRWYGLSGLGLRGQRPLFAGIGFAVLGWVTFLLFRLMVENESLGTGFRDFIFLLLFEAFAVQIWVFGLLFRTLSAWRGPLTAAVSSGVVFGAIAAILFQYAFIPNASGVFYFVLWGIMYGIIRLRTGSILGAVIVQSMQSFTSWVVLVPSQPPDPAQMTALYLASGFFYLVIIWRLWPKREDDYRV
jgi:hypothetical protein